MIDVKLLFENFLKVVKRASLNYEERQRKITVTCDIDVIVEGCELG
jgi:hypothetical protein